MLHQCIVIIVGYTVGVTFTQVVLPTSPDCTIPTCGVQTISSCIIHEDTVEWLDPNSEVITTHNQSRIYVEHTAHKAELKFHNCLQSDEGNYTCRSVDNHSMKATVILQVNVRTHFIYNNCSSEYSYKDTALRYHDKLINCSVELHNNLSTQWEHKDHQLQTTNNTKYSQNCTGLIIHNVTEHDQGNYNCLIGNGNPLIATASLNVVWRPELLFEQNQTVLVNVSEQVILNCTVSSSPDPVYNWSIPDTCSSCPHTDDDSVMIFTADITGSGEYVCEAGNEYGSIRMTFIVKILSLPIIPSEPKTIITDESDNNVVLSCDIDYAYPHPDISWSIMTSSSDQFVVLHENTTDYELHADGNVEIFRRFLFEEGYVVVMCSASNFYRSVVKMFTLWEREAFEIEETFLIYVGNIANCNGLKQDANGLRKELMDTLRVWFSDVCNCNGNNNLYTPQLTCLNTTTGSVTSTVRHDGDMTAQMLIDLAVADIHANDPPLVSLPQHGWILFLDATNRTATDIVSTNGNSRRSIVLEVCVGISCIVALLLVLLIVGLVYGIYKRKKEPTSKNSNNTHVYEDVDEFSPAYSTPQSNNHSNDTKAVVFKVQPPVYSSLTTLTHDRYKNQSKETLNDYHIVDDENAKEIMGNHKSVTQNDQPYNRLVHFKQ